MPDSIDGLIVTAVRFKSTVKFKFLLINEIDIMTTRIESRLCYLIRNNKIPFDIIGNSSKKPNKPFRTLHFFNRHIDLKFLEFFYNSLFFVNQLKTCYIDGIKLKTIR